MFPSVTLSAFFAIPSLISTNPKGILPVLSSSVLACLFTYSRSASYLGKTTLKLSPRLREHKPGTRKSITSEIVAHLADTGDQRNDETFKVIYKVPGNWPKAVCQLHLATAMRLLNQSLCSQKTLSNQFS